MTTFRTLALAFAVAAAMSGCANDETATDAQADAPRSSIEGSVESGMASAMAQVREELATQNISLDGPAGAPKAEITPEGALLIDGHPVELTDAQRALLLDYRANVAAVASAGAEVGVEGARLASRAVGDALRGVLSGDVGEVEQRVSAQAESIRGAAQELCERLPAMYETQQALAAAVPAFAPYATMDLGDIEDCRKDAVHAQASVPPAPPAPPAAPAAPEPPPAG